MPALPDPDPPLNAAELKYRSEALKEIRDWSNKLIQVQTAGAAGLGLWLQQDLGPWSRGWSIATLVFVVLSLVVGAIYLAAMIPYCLATLPYRRRDEQDIYYYQGGIPGRTISYWTRAQSGFFIASVVCFAFAAAFAKPAPKPAEPPALPVPLQVEITTPTRTAVPQPTRKAEF